MNIEYMNDEILLQDQLSFTTISVRAIRLGADYCITVGGGDRPHIGCTVLALPRPSLAGDGTMGSTSSVFNVTGHKDDIICRKLAESVASRKNATIVCAGGIHLEVITPGQIKEIENSIEKLAEYIVMQ